MSEARVYSYLRFSDAKQADGHSIERQLAYAERWASDNGLVLDTRLSMRDEGLSAYHQRHVQRGALGVFLAAVEAGQVPHGSVLVVEGLDRLSRAEPILAQAQLASIVNAGITVVTASDNKVYSRERLKANPMDLIYSLLVMIRAHEESDTKSKRVRDAIHRQCRAWVNGTSRNLVRYGKTPGWLQVVDGQWTQIPERSAALKEAVDLYLQGHGAGSIASRLHEAGKSFGGVPPSSGQLVRLLAHPALAGDKVVQIDGESYTLVDYYPPVIDRATHTQIQQALQQRSRSHIRGDIPSMLTGMQITLCGYCGAPMKAQTMASKRRTDGTILDCNRRLQCTRVNHGERCSVAGSCSAAPIERAIMNYCSDLVNLKALQAGDLTAGPLADLATARAMLAKVDSQLERLMTALLEDDAAPPASFTRRARELEAERTTLLADVEAAERALSAAARSNVDGTSDLWKELVDGVNRLDTDARLKARQLVADTFSRVLVYHKGIRPRTTSPGTIDVLLVAKGGITRALRIDKHGGWVAQESVESTLDAAAAYPLAAS